MVLKMIIHNSIFLMYNIYVSFNDNSNRRVNETNVISFTFVYESVLSIRKWFAKFWTIFVLAYIYYSLKEQIQFIQWCWRDQLKILKECIPVQFHEYFVINVITSLCYSEYNLNWINILKKTGTRTFHQNVWVLWIRILGMSLY